MKELKLLELFGGVGAPRRALELCGLNIKSIDYVEVLPYAVMAYNNIFDISYKPQDIVNWNLDVDILVHGSPCFTGDTLVMTNKGYKNIKDIQCGDLVLTHKNQYKPVVNFFNNGAKEILKVYTTPCDVIKTTGNHKFLVRTKSLNYPVINGKQHTQRLFTEPYWKHAEELTKNDFMGFAINQNSIVPDWRGTECTRGKSKYIKNSLDMNDKSLWYMAGRFLGDGWTRTRHERNSNLSGIIICCAKYEQAEFEKKIPSYLPYTKIEEKTVIKYQFPNKEFAVFCSQFGKGAIGKRIPGFILNLPSSLLDELLHGYFDSDGCCTNGNVHKAGTISKELAYGIGHCIAKVYHRSFSIYKTKRPPTCVIEGRVVKQHDTYTVAFRKTTERSEAIYENGYLWFPVRKIVNTNEKETVFDIEVQDDHSFMANGIIAHNCQDFTKEGHNDTNTGRSILYQRTLEIIDHGLRKRPPVVIWENVPNLASQGKKVSHKHHLDHYIDTMEKMGYVSTYAILDASKYGIPQARERLYVVSLLSGKEYQFPQEIPLKYKLKDFLDKTVKPEDYPLSAAEEKLFFQKDGKLFVREATKLGYKEVEEGDCINVAFPTSQTRRGRVGKGVAKTLTTSPRQAVYINGHTRMLTTKEHWRLMGFKDRDYVKMRQVGLSDNQISHLAGNSICVPVLKMMFQKLIEMGEIPMEYIA